MPHVSVKPEQITSLFGLSITNSLVTSLIVSALFAIMILYYNAQSKRPTNMRSGFYYLLNGLLRQIYTLFHSITEDKITYLFPLLGAFFFFILLQNWFGLLPGVGSILVKAPHEEKVSKADFKGEEAKEGEYASETDMTHETDEEEQPAAVAESTVPPAKPEEAHGAEKEHFIPLLRGGTADLNTTLALGILAVIAIQFCGVKFLGAKAYLGKFFNFKGPIDFFIGILEIVSEFSRAFSFSFRLFGNIIAGEILLVIIATLVPVLVSFPFVVMEIFVGLIQAVVFSTLAAIFIKMAITKAH
jgi:F-type H+-transporting ATPase subunit a